MRGARSTVCSSFIGLEGEVGHKLTLLSWVPLTSYEIKVATCVWVAVDGEGLSSLLGEGQSCERWEAA